MRIVVLLLVCILAAPAWAQTPGDSPATANSRRQVIVPEGFVRVSAASRDALCAEDDESWVREALASVEPATRPSTMPADLIGRLESSREQIAGQIAADLPIDPPAIQAVFDEKLLPMLRQFDALDPPIIYMPVTREKLRQLLRDGWEDPRFRYNRVSDDVVFNMSVNLGLDGQTMDDALIPAIHLPADAVERRKEILTDTIRQSEAEVTSAIADRSMFLTQMAFVQLVNDQAITPLKLQADQAWLGLGASGFLAAKYASPILGVPRDALVEAMTFEHPRNPVKVASVDLLHPTPASELRDKYVALYLDAMRRKSILAVQAWTKQAGDEAIGKTLAALRSEPCPDGAALVELIRRSSGVDLTGNLSP